MPSLTLKDIPVELMERLRSAARRERRSLTQQVFIFIEGGLAERDHRAGQPSPAAARQVARWRELAGRWASDESFADEVAALAEARTSGRTVDL
ncbi:MAG: hypothetical protein GXP62_22060 [Oligoflexia bacterium]|nr:hypothetical protein [Oligoflexia bacterium]